MRYGSSWNGRLTGSEYRRIGTNRMSEDQRGDEPRPCDGLQRELHRRQRHEHDQSAIGPYADTAAEQARRASNPTDAATSTAGRTERAPTG